MKKRDIVRNYERLRMYSYIKMIIKVNDKERFCNATVTLTSRYTRCTDTITGEYNKEKRWESFDEGERRELPYRRDVTAQECKSP